MQDLQFLIDHRDSYIKGKTWDGAYEFATLASVLRREVGAIEFSKRVVGLDRLGTLMEFEESLKLFERGGVSPASPFTDYEKLWGEPLNHTRKLFEFYAASGINLNGKNAVEIAKESDHSQHNPDILIGDGYSIMGIACKVVSGLNIQTVIENIEKASLQVKVSKASKGVALLDVRNRIDNELLITKTGVDSYRTFKCTRHAEEVIQGELATLADQVLDATSPQWRQDRYEETSCKAFILHAHSCAILETGHGPVPTCVGKARIVPIIDGQDPELDDALELGGWIGNGIQISV